jgi:hypothetical protein
MAINWNSIVEGTSAGIAASVILGAAIISRERFRNIILRFRLSRIIRKASVGEGIDGVTTSISNQVGWPFVVRELSLCTDKLSYRMNPTGKVETVFKGRYPKLTRTQKKTIKHGTAIEIGSEIQYRSWREEPTVEGFITVSPYTSHQFILPSSLVVDYESEVRFIRLILEYVSVTGVPKILKIEESRWANALQKMLIRHRDELRTGKLNEARRRFGKPPILSQKQVTETKPNNAVEPTV